ncbi:dihydrodipicolinate synthase family protein [Micromonospora sp. C28SCA-DRY-2]|uniref:dihydrodipicolinate synthase family protein n=1 Tax=Micromonospora sp. C28SCA-DRY-2 TaxID=3059522 RepID=UPI0026760554|nr:dihydrodipicolinate synthase family protein [Micromonospora sp. C28SCA-DRY-2]MDO3705120.1 dihydrodipicolinate synthase family protein [Micromonospora sp. C28SCA-DRY-2]
MIAPTAAALRDRLRWRLIAATATPVGAAGAVDPDVLGRYLDGLVADGADALAVLAHTGRGPYLDEATRDLVVRRAVETGVPVIVGVGGRPGERTDEVAAQAERAAALGAAGLLVFPVDDDPVGHHDALWRAAGLPLLAFDLYLRPYPEPALAALLDHPGVAGVKVARLHDAIACQAALAAAHRADRLAVTGEDRMFGPSLMWGAEAALVGLAAAAVPVTARALRAYADKRYDEFLTASADLDRLAEVTFTAPMEGYVQRMLWIAAAEGRVPATHAVDPHAPALPEGDRDRVLRVAGCR